MKTYFLEEDDLENFPLYESMETSLLISLFTDARISDIELHKSEKQNRGYFGDAIFGETTGSKLWTLSREKMSSMTLQKAKQYSLDALHWLILENIARKIDVNSYFKNNQLFLDIFVLKTDGMTMEFKDISL